jgi:hypothetical protein
VGCKTAAIFVTTAEPDYFRTEPEHDPDKALELIDMLELGQLEAGEVVTYSEAMYPPDGELALGAYDNGFALSDKRLHGQVTEKHHALRDKILFCFPSSHVIAIELESGINLYGYSVYENGTLVRALGGSHDAGCVIDLGAHMPEEEPHFANSKTIDNKLVFTTSILGSPKNFELSSYGESLVFAVAARVLGENSRWSGPGEDLMVQLFTKPTANAWHKPQFPF